MKGERKEALQPHPLEGKYIIFKYWAQEPFRTHDREGTSLALFKLNHGEMEKINRPHALKELNLETLEMENNENEELLAVMKQIGMKEVYSVTHSYNFFGLPINSIFEPLVPLDPNYPDELAKYEPLKNTDAEFDLLKEAGINIKFFDERKRRVLNQAKKPHT